MHAHCLLVLRRIAYACVAFFNIVGAMVAAEGGGSSAPVFVEQPLHRAAVPGGSVSLTARATGTPAPAYQWFKDGAALNGATGSSFAIARADASHAGLYHVVARNSGGSARSNAVRVLMAGGTRDGMARTTQPEASLDEAPLLRFTTLAGQSSVGTADGIGAAARFYYPAGIVADAAGNVFVTDVYNSTIRKITSTGTVTTFAGQPREFGSNDGTGTGARFNYPYDIAIDGSGNLYIADTFNQRVRKVTPAGVVSTLVNLGGLTGALPMGIAVDSSGANIYISDPGLQVIHRVNSAGTITTLAGAANTMGYADGTGAAARFSSPMGLALAPNGNLYVADTNSSMIRMITPAGEVSTVAGALNQDVLDGVGTAARFILPVGLCFDAAGKLYITDLVGHSIRVMNAAGEVTTLAGVARSEGAVDGPAMQARFSGSRGVAAGLGGKLHVADSGTNTIRTVAADGSVTTLAGQAGYGSTNGNGANARFHTPSSIARDSSGKLYVADTRNHVIRLVMPNGDVSTFAGAPGQFGWADAVGSAARFTAPWAVAVDAAGNVYVSDLSNYVIRKITPAGSVSTLAGLVGGQGAADGAGSSARFGNVTGIAVDAAGNVYAADSFAATIRKITPAGVVTTLAGLAFNYGASDGSGQSARFRDPRSVAVDSGGNVYVFDFGLIRKVTPGGVVTTLAGSPTHAFVVDGSGASARFGPEGGLVVDTTGGIYVVESAYSVLRHITPAGLVRTIAGNLASTDTTDGVGLAARFNRPSGIAVDSAGKVYIADTNNHTIRVGSPVPGPEVTSQPANVVATSGQPATFSAQATSPSGGALSYTWQRDGITLGATTSGTFTLPSVTRADAGLYRVAINDGLQTTYSNAFMLSVAPTQYLDFIVPDPAFKPRIENSNTGAVHAWLELQPGGHVFIGGNFTSIGSVPRNYLAVIHSSGELHADYTPPLLDGPVETIVRQPDGRILIGGRFTTVNGVPAGQLFRLHANGTLDSSFSVGEGFSFSSASQSQIAGVRAIVLQPDGRILVGGNFQRFQGAVRPALARLNADGSLDTGFVPASAVTSGELVRGVVRAIHVQTDGRIVVGGSFGKKLARLNLDGTLDTTFEAMLGGGFSGNVYAVRGTSDGKMWIGGEFTAFNGTTVPRLIRLNGNGTRDPSFDASGLPGGLGVLQIEEQSDGRLIVGGDGIKPTRLTATGALDAAAIFPAGAFATTVAVQPRLDGTFFIAGSQTSNSGAPGTQPVLYALTTSPSPPMTVEARAPANIAQVALAPGGGFFAAGDFTHIQGEPRSGLVRFTSSGTIDSSFHAGALQPVRHLVVQGDGKILVATANSLHRLTPTGSVDPSYIISDGATVSALRLDSAGRTLVSRFFSSGLYRVERLTSSGSLDLGFVPAVLGNGPAVALAVQLDGKVLVGLSGNQTINSESVSGMARLLSDGRRDPSFSFAVSGSTERNISVQADGRIVSGRDFATIGVSTLNRILSTGASDASFDAFFPGSNTSSQMSATLAIHVLPDGRILRAGGRTSVAGVPWSRHGVNGARDTNFTADASPFLSVTSFDILDDGRLVAATSEGLRIYRAGTSPAIATQPVASTATVGATAAFSVAATGGGLSYQWYFNSAAIPGATNATLALPDVTPSGAGSYSVTVTNVLGSITSNTVALGIAPKITDGFASRNVGVGGRTEFRVEASGPALAYQWRKNNVDIPGETKTSFAIPVVTAADAGNYSVRVSNSVSSVGAGPATLTVLPNPLSYSSRQIVGGAGLNAFFSVAGTEPKRVLLRALGPTLASLGVLGGIADPAITLLDSNGQLVASNDNWGDVTGFDLPGIFAQVGAAPLAPGSKDAVVYAATLSPGSYTVSITGVNGSSGVALLELFDADANKTSRIAYLGVRGATSPLHGAAHAGLTITNSADKRLLVRAIGPTLGAGVTNPELRLRDGPFVVSANDDWSPSAALTTAIAQAGAFALPPGSADAALLVESRIGTGTYTAEAGLAAGSGSGDVLIEFYDIQDGTYVAPLVVIPPLRQTAVLGSNIVLSAHAIGSGTLTYQWRKGGVALGNATQSMLSFSPVQASDVGNYDVVVTNGTHSAASSAAALNVIPAGFSATQAVEGTGYFAGSTVTITNTLNYTGNASTFLWSATLPPGWSFASDAGSAGDVKPFAGDKGTIGWAWTTPIESPVTFSYTLNVPAGENGPKTLGATAQVRIAGAEPTTFAVSPDPLTVHQITTHDADVDRNFRINLIELTRVIELYNTRNSTTRTGSYSVGTTATEDGFAPDPGRAPNATASLGRYHSGDTNRDGKLNLIELTRVIELYNYRAGTTRTGQYHLQSGTEDGFGPGP